MRLEYIKARQRAKKMTDPSDAINSALDDFMRHSMGAMVPPSRKNSAITSLVVTEINRVVDGDILMSPLILGLIYTRKKELELQELIHRRKEQETWKRKHWE